MSRRSLTLAINRVEGDLEVSVDISNHLVVKAQVAGTMFRGFEQMMSGRGLLDGLVITPAYLRDLQHQPSLCGRPRPRLTAQSRNPR